jgi:hypothetical protein
MTSRIGLVCVLLILFGAGRLASEEAAPIQAQDKTWIDARIWAHETTQATREPTEQPYLKPNALEWRSPKVTLAMLAFHVGVL